MKLLIHQAITLIKAQKQRGTVVIVSSHDLRIIQQLCDHIVILKRGRLVFDHPLTLSTQNTSSSLQKSTELNLSPTTSSISSTDNLSFRSLDELYAHYTLS